MKVAEPVSPIILFCITLLLPASFILYGARLSVHGINELLIANESKTWQVSSGKILRSEVLYRHNKRGGKSYTAITSYNFTFAGDIFTGNSISFGRPNSVNNPFLLREIINYYYVGKDVLVYVRPNDPHYNVLEPGVNISCIIGLGYGILFVVIGILWIFIAQCYKGKFNSSLLLSPRIIFILFRFFPFILFIFGIWYQYKHCQKYLHFQYFSSASTSSTNGTIINSNIDIHNKRKGGYTYVPNIRYNYSIINNHTITEVYYGHKLSFFDPIEYLFYSDAEKVVKEYYLGKMVTVYFHINDPHNSVLKPHLNQLSFNIFSATGIFFITVSIFIACFPLKKLYLEAVMNLPNFSLKHL